MLQFVAVCCSVLQCVAVCCSVLQCVAVCYSVLQCVAVRCSSLQSVAVGARTGDEDKDLRVKIISSASIVIAKRFATTPIVEGPTQEIDLFPQTFSTTLTCQYLCLHTAYTPPHTATHCNTLQHTTTHCNTLQHTATHCNTLQHTATSFHR